MFNKGETMRLLAVFVVLAGMGSVALADDCYRSRAVYQTYQQTYVAPTYYTPYQYTPTYNYASYAATVYVPKVLEVEVQRDHYYSLDPIAAIARLLKQEREGWQQQQQPQEPAPVQPPPVQPQLQRQIQRPQAQAPSRAPLFQDRSRPSAYQNAELVAMIQGKCIKCHAAEQKLPLLTPDGSKLLDLSQCAALDVYFRVNTGDMPKTAPPVDDKFMPLLAEWARASK